MTSKKQIEDRLFCGEDYRTQYKTTFRSIDALAVEIAAFANSDGGTIFVGVNDEGQAVGLGKGEIQQLNQWISSVTSQKMEPPLFVQTEAVNHEGKRLLLVHVPRGTNKPYAVNKGHFWVKNGADKRRASREELFRLMQASGQLYADEMNSGLPLADFDQALFERKYREYYGEFLELSDLTSTALLTNLKLVVGDELTLAGALLFSTTVDSKKPQFAVKTICYSGPDSFTDKMDIRGTLAVQYKETCDFFLRNLHRSGTGNDFNEPGKLPVPIGALREAIANALIHRDYFVNAPVACEAHPDRIRIISPGTLPNTLNVESIQLGVHIERNPILLSFIEREKDFGYAGHGSGIPRILRLCRDAGVSVNFTNDTARNQFIVEFSLETTQKVPESTDKTTQKVPPTAQKTPLGTTQKILEILKAQPTAGRVEIADQIGSITEDGVKYHLAKMKKQGLIRRVGPAKGGHWEVNSET